jgi:CubicO group peptidase (beta-lactamase class C family)
LARLVEVVAGRPYAEFLHERLFAPLQMMDTGYVVSDEKVERLAAIYAPPEDGPMACIETAQQSPYRDPQRRADGGTGLVSTVGDYLRFAQMLLNRGELDGVRLLSRKSVELMTSNHLAPEVMPTFDGLERSRGYYTKGYGFGLGVRVLLDPAANATVGSKGNYGWGGLWNTYFWVDPVEELIGCI